MKIEHEATFQKALEDGINLFAGAGFSVLAKNATNEYLPVGALLKDKLIDELELTKLSTLSLPQISAILEAERKDDFYAFLKRLYTVTHFDESSVRSFL